MRFPRSFASLVALALLLATPPAAQSRDLLTRVSPASGPAATLASRPLTPLLAVDRAALDELRAARAGTLALPLADGSAVELVLERRELFAPDAQVTVTDATGAHPLALDLAVFRGRVPGEPGTWAVVTLSPDGVRATVARGGERLLLMPASPASGAGGELPLHALAAEAVLETRLAPWTCGVDGANEAELERGDGSRAPAAPGSVQIDAPRRVFSLAIDCDEEIVAVKFGGNLTAATNYVTALLATVSLIYEKDLDVTLNVGYLNFWTTTDPYTQGSSDPQLTQLRTWWNANRSGVSRSLMHLLSGRDLGGGIAYVDVLCASTTSGYGYGLSAIDCAYAYPTNASTWDANVVAHELGHNFGSWHTHSCNWAAQGYLSPASALIDTCQASEGGCNVASNRLPPDKGTIMSYCHQLSGGVAANIRMDFHPVCVTRMRQRADAAGCATSPVVAPPRNVSAAAIPTGVRVAWSAGGSPGVIGYNVYRSRLAYDPNPAWLGSTAGLFFDDTEMGPHFYKVRAIRAADSSGFGSEVKLDLCPLAAQPALAAGSTPVAIATADFTGDGIADLAVANQAGASVSLFAGNGSGGVGDGTFAPAVVIPTAANAQCLLATDTNGDGLLDLVVGAASDSSLWLYPGGGAGGVPNGTFGSGTRVPLGFVPSSAAVADFDENGLPDFVVAGHPSGVVLLFGGGSGGVPDGTYGAPVLVSFGATSRFVVVGDFDENGIWDIAVTTNTWLRVLRGLGTGGVGNGTFMTPSQVNAGTNAYELVTGDFNMDGITDLFVVYSTASGAGMLLGNGSAGVGNGTFPAAPTAVTVGANARSPRVGDWNGDGIPDIALVNGSTAMTAGVLTGKGNGTFNGALTWVASTTPYALALGDWNGDGGIDLAAVNRGANTVTPLLAGCVNAQSLALAVTFPAGGDTLIETVNRTLTWTRGAGVAQVDVQVSRDGGATWATIARNQSGTEFTWTPTAPATTQARLRVVDTARGWVMAQSASDFSIFPQSVLSAGFPAVASRFAVLGAWPNPARGAFSVSLSLPEGGRGARLELLDLAGRRVADVPLGALAAGVHVVPLPGAGLRPGLYLVRLTGPGATSTRKVAVLD